MVITLDLSPAIELTDEQFAAICRQNRDLRLEKNTLGKLIVMPPTGGETGERNSSIAGQLWMWNQRHKLGRLFDSSTGFRLPNGATRSPDAAWIENQRWQTLSPAERQGFVPLCPDFVIELKSPTDGLINVQKKMEEYLDNGVQLGWLIVPEQRSVIVYQAGTEAVVRSNPAQVSADPVLPGFVLEMADIFGPRGGEKG